MTIEEAYEKGREDMRNEVLKLLDGGDSRLLGLEPLKIDSVASEGILDNRSPNAN